jgi:hypothetical protein
LCGLSDQADHVVFAPPHSAQDGMQRRLFGTLGADPSQ